MWGSWVSLNGVFLLGMSCHSFEATCWLLKRKLRKKLIPCDPWNMTIEFRCLLKFWWISNIWSKSFYLSKTSTIYISLHMPNIGGLHNGENISTFFWWHMFVVAAMLDLLKEHKGTWKLSLLVMLRENANTFGQMLLQLKKCCVVIQMTNFWTHKGHRWER